MGFFLRKITKAKWTKPEESWLMSHEIHADTLVDLRTSENRLSVWYIENDKKNLNNIIIALASNCDEVSNIDYALFDETIIRDNSFEIRQTTGKTPDEDANKTWHRDLIQLSADKLVILAKNIYRFSEKERIYWKSVKNDIKEALSSGRLNKDKIKPKIQEEILH
jgi:hypothetical protein